MAIINPSGTDDPRVGEVAARLMSLVAGKLEDPAQRGSLRADVTAADVFMAVAMLAAILLKTDGRSKRQMAQQAWALLERGLTR